MATALTGCSGTRFGDQLARSFSAPEPQRPAAPTPATPASRATSLESGKPAQKPSTSKPAGSKPAATPTGTGPDTTTRPAPRPVAAPSTPAPYRVTIRLPAADPSAPAEQVTEVLRAAGVPFEVETIERIGTAGGGATVPLAPLRTPAPAPR